jgi:hypothetical protein
MSSNNNTLGSYSLEMAIPSTLTLFKWQYFRQSVSTSGSTVQSLGYCLQMAILPVITHFKWQYSRHTPHIAIPYNSGRLPMAIETIRLLKWQYHRYVLSSNGNTIDMCSSQMAIPSTCALLKWQYHRYVLSSNGNTRDKYRLQMAIP